MGIIKHYRSNDPPQNAMDYLVRADTDAAEAYIIDGINTTPHDIAGHYYMDHLRIFGRTTRNTCSYHHYVISFHPGDRDRGLTPELAHAYGMAFARKYFCGCRIVVCAHDSAHIHVHIIVLALRYMDALPDPGYMRTDNAGNVYENEYRAGHLIHHSNRLWHSMMDHLSEFCKNHGYAVTPVSAETRISSGEYYCQQAGEQQLQNDNALRDRYGIPLAKTEYITRNEELRRAIRDATANSADWYGFQQRLETHYTRRVEVGPCTANIPLPELKRMQQKYRDIERDYRSRQASLLESCNEECVKKQQWLRQCYADLKRARDSQIIFKSVPNRKVRECQEAAEYAKQELDAAKQQNATLLLAQKVYACYAKAAAIALAHQMPLDATQALDQMALWQQYQDGIWTEAWHLSDTASYLLRDGKLYRRRSWKNTTDEDLRNAEHTLRRIQNDSLSIEADQRGIKTEERAFPISVKIEKEKIYYRHPDDERWVSGYALGDDYTLEAIQRQIQFTPTPTKTKTIDASR